MDAIAWVNILTGLSNPASVVTGGAGFIGSNSVRLGSRFRG
jgi:hypothetical protein